LPIFSLYLFFSTLPSFFFLLLVLIVISCPSPHAFFGDRKNSVAIKHTPIVGWRLKHFGHPRRKARDEFFFPKMTAQASIKIQSIGI